VRLQAQYEVWDKGWLQASGRFVGQRKTQKGGELNAYALMDLGFEQSFTFSGVNWIAKVFVDNLTGTTYMEQAGYPMPRQVWGFQLGMSL
jgi:outer membrane receptor protein involved in Fe transport